MIPGIVAGAAVTGGGGDPYWANVSSLLHFDGANGSTTFTDQKGLVWTPVNSAAISTAQYKFGGASSQFLPSPPLGGGGVAQRITTPDDASLRFGTGNFTIEGWFRPAAPNLDNGAFWIKGNNTTGGIGLGVTPTACKFRANGSNDLTPSATISTTAFTHIAFCREGTTRRIYVGGVQVGSDTLSFDHNDTSSVIVGSSAGDTRFAYNGYIDDLRVTKGVCRYPGGTTFTPPTAAFPDS